MALEFPHFDPVALDLGFFAIRWYALAYITGFVGGLFMVKHYLDKYPSRLITKTHMDDLLTWTVIGVILGGRMGYVLFYNLGYYIENPIDALKIWQGGMAFHGGLLGVIAAMVLFAWKNKIPLLALSDRVAVVAPIGLFFGRIANFINGELVGRATDAPWGMIFHDGDVPRHPSQIYQAATEGLVLFIIMVLMQRRASIRNHYGLISGAFLTAYATMRFFVEYTRKPDTQIGYLVFDLSMGQLLCIPMMLVGFGIMIYARTRSTEAR